MNWDNYDEIEIIEAAAEQLGLPYCDEESLSAAFDEHIAPMVIERFGADDECAMNEAFNNWTDMLCKDGEMHAIQYGEYCYVGQYAGEEE